VNGKNVVERGDPTATKGGQTNSLAEIIYQESWWILLTNNKVNKKS